MVWVTQSTVSSRVGIRYLRCNSSFSGAFVDGVSATGGAGSGSGPSSAETRVSISRRTASARSYSPRLSYQRGDSFSRRVNSTSSRPSEPHRKTSRQDQSLSGTTALAMRLVAGVPQMPTTMAYAWYLPRTFEGYISLT